MLAAVGCDMNVGAVDGTDGTDVIVFMFKAPGTAHLCRALCGLS